MYSSLIALCLLSILCLTSSLEVHSKATDRFATKPTRLNLRCLKENTLCRPQRGIRKCCEGLECQEIPTSGLLKKFQCMPPVPTGPPCDEFNPEGICQCTDFWLSPTEPSSVADISSKVAGCVGKTLPFGDRIQIPAPLCRTTCQGDTVANQKIVSGVVQINGQDVGGDAFAQCASKNVKKVFPYVGGELPLCNDVRAIYNAAPPRKLILEITEDLLDSLESCGVPVRTFSTFFIQLSNLGTLDQDITNQCR